MLSFSGILHRIQKVIKNLECSLRHSLLQIGLDQSGNISNRDSGAMKRASEVGQAEFLHDILCPHQSTHEVQIDPHAA